MSIAARHSILIANDLLSGDVLFMGEQGWVDSHKQARIAAPGPEAEALEAQGKLAMKTNKVVDAYLVDVIMDSDGTPVPTHYREKMRTTGPTIRPDLGKQAESSKEAGQGAGKILPFTCTSSQGGAS